MLSFLKRSRCPLKVLNLNANPRRSADFRCLLEVLPSLESLCLSFRRAFNSTSLMDDILIRIFRSASDTSVDAPLESFLSNIQFMECRTGSTHAPFSWDRIPQLYFQGHRRSLTLKCAATNSYKWRNSTSTVTAGWRRIWLANSWCNTKWRFSRKI